ncbi:MULTISPECIES: nucleosidase [Kocuria]|uniref:Nucleosidase n=1 Tax=Kocuria subflava TaxID=1736139 RepID=A0A846TTS9_9MICC|nr:MULTISPECIES: nucleosidase [Kocuria]NKE08677.1 nucleosidase [Kocuria subflava]
MTDLLVVAAHPAETTYLPAGTDVVLTGIGMSRAATHTTRAIVERVPDARNRGRLTVVNLGSCGGLCPGAHGIFEPSLVINRDIDAELMRAMGSDPQESINLTEMGQPGDGSVLATGDSFVAGGPVRDALEQRADLVNMEGFAVAVACREMGVGLRMVKHVSDDAGEQALDWATRVDQSARALADWWENFRSGESPA